PVLDGVLGQESRRDLGPPDVPLRWHSLAGRGGGEPPGLAGAGGRADVALGHLVRSLRCRSSATRTGPGGAGAPGNTAGAGAAWIRCGAGDGGGAGARPAPVPIREPARGGAA